MFGKTVPKWKLFDQIFATTSEELADVCSVFSKTTVKSPVPIEQLEEIIQNMHASGDSGDSSAAVLPLEGDTLLYVPLKISAKIKRRSMIDTGACASAIPESLYREIFSVTT